MPWLVSMRMMGQVMGARATVATRRSVILRSEGLELGLVFGGDASRFSPAHKPAPSAAVSFRKERLPSLFVEFRLMAKPPLNRHQRSLHHSAGIPHLEREGRISAAAGITANAATVAIVVERAGMFGINLSRVLVLHQLLHDEEHVVLAFVDEYLGVSFVRLLYPDIAEVDVVDAVARGEVGAYFDGVPAQDRKSVV